MSAATRLLLVSLVLPLVVSCASDKPIGAIQEPHVFDELGTHVVTHPPGTCTACDLFRKVRGFIVLLDTAVCIQAGVVLGTDGTVVTNAQVVGTAPLVEVTTFKLDSWVGTVAARDVELDLAVVTVPPSEKRWAPPDLNPGPPPPVGEEVFLIGHPVGIGWCVTRGIITGSKRVNGVSMLLTDATFLPGNSGGALVDGKGRLVGIVSSMHETDDFGESAMARPTAAVLAFLESVQSLIR